MSSRRRFLQQTAIGMSLPTVGSWAVDAPTSAGTLRFAYFTDVHGRVEWETPLAMAQTAEAINREKPDLVIGGGDFITDGFQNTAATVAPRWDAYMDALHKGIKAELRPVIGNHDLVAAIPEDGSDAAKDPRAIYRAKMELDRTWYSFDARGYHFVVLDSFEILGGERPYRGFIGEEQLTWLEEDLAKVSSDTPIILCCHMPLISVFFSASRGNNEALPGGRLIENNRDVLKRFRGKNLILVLQGHLHVDELIRWQSTTFITGGAVCAKWWRGPWYETQEGFGMVTIKDGRVQWEYRDIGWEAKRPVGQ